MSPWKRWAVGSAVGVWGLAPSIAVGQPLELAPTVVMRSARGALQNVEPLVDPDTFFIFRNQTKTTTITLTPLRFSGSVELTAGCCYDLPNGQGASPSGITVSLSARQASFEASQPATVTLTVTTTNSPATGSMLIIVNARSLVPPVDTTLPIRLTVLPPIPADGPRSPCPRLNPAAGSIPGPPAHPEALPVSSTIGDLFTTKESAPSETSFPVGAAAIVGNNGWDIRIDRAGLTPPLTANEAFIVFHNPKTWNKTLATVNSANCDANPQILNVAPGQTGSFRISRSTTTTLLLSRQHCSLWVFGCWDSVLEDVAYFNEAGFWSLVGGRRVTITWSTSVQKWGAIVLER